MGNPVLSRSEAFTGSGTQYAPPLGPDQYGNFAAPGQQGQYGTLNQPPVYQAPQAVMTLDDVVTKTTLTMVALLITALATFVLFPPQFLGAGMIVSGIVGFVTVLLVSFRRVVPPAGVLVYALIEGVFIGALSRIFEYMYPGIVVQAVLGTFAAAGATLAAYKFFNIKVTSKMKKFVLITTAAYAGVMLLNLVLSLFNINMGLWSGGQISFLGLLMSLLGAGLATFNLLVDFDYIETGIRNRVPASESWRAALGITVTMVWLYTEILRILSYFRR